VQPLVVDLSDVFDDHKIKLHPCARDTDADQLGLDAVDEALGRSTATSAPPDRLRCHP
jgi:hypothetical protein